MSAIFAVMIGISAPIVRPETQSAIIVLDDNRWTVRVAAEKRLRKDMDWLLAWHLTFIGQKASRSGQAQVAGCCHMLAEDYFRCPRPSDGGQVPWIDTVSIIAVDKDGCQSQELLGSNGLTIYYTAIGVNIINPATGKYWGGKMTVYVVGVDEDGNDLWEYGLPAWPAQQHASYLWGEALLRFGVPRPWLQKAIDDLRKKELRLYGDCQHEGIRRHLGLAPLPAG